MLPPVLSDVAEPMEEGSLQMQASLAAWGITYGLKKLPTAWPGPMPVPVDPVNMEGLAHVPTFVGVKTDGILMGLHLRWGMEGVEDPASGFAVAMDRTLHPHLCKVQCEDTLLGAQGSYGTVVEGELVRRTDGSIEYGIFDIWWWCGEDCTRMSVSEAREFAMERMGSLAIEGVDRVFFKEMVPAHRLREVWEGRDMDVPCDGLLLTPDVPRADRYQRHPALKLKRLHTVDFLVLATKCTSADNPLRGELRVQILVACRNKSHGRTSSAMQSVFQVMMYDRDIIMRLKNNRGWRRFCKSMLKDMSFGECRHVVVEFAAHMRDATEDEVEEALERDKRGVTAQYMRAMDIDLYRKAQSEIRKMEPGSMKRFAHEVSLAHATGLEAAQGITSRTRDYGYYCELVFQRSRPDKKSGNTYTAVAMMLSSSMDMWQQLENTFLPPREIEDEAEEDVNMM